MALDAECLRRIVLLDKLDALYELAEKLEFEGDISEENSQKELSLLHLYDVIMTSASFGSTWDEIVQFVELAQRLQQAATESKLAATIQTFKQEYETMAGRVRERNAKLFADYFFQTFMKHFQLYKYTLSHPRATKTVKYEVTVDTPTEACVSKTGLPLNIWEYEQEYKAVEKAEEEARMKFMEEKEKLALHGMDSEHLVDKEDLNNAADSEEEMRLLIEEITRHHVGNLSDRISLNIQATMEDLEYKFDKTNLARPQVMGPPPRFKPPTPTQQLKKSAGKPDKPPSRGKSRESKKK